MTFREYLQGLITTPLLAYGREIRNLITVLASVAEDARKAMHRTRRLWFPSTAPAEALEVLGTDRGLPRLPGETAASYRSRLQRAHLFYAAAGTQRGMEAALAAIGYPAAEVYPLYKEVQNWRYLDGSLVLDGTWHLGAVREPAHPEWLPENMPEAWNKFVVYLHSGAELEPGEAQRLREIIRMTQPAKAVLHELYP